MCATRRSDQLPVISRFLGIDIAMYWNDHLPPHFHAKYGEYEMIVHIQNGTFEGRFPRRGLLHVLEWYELHRNELLTNWELCRTHEVPLPVDPLE